MTVSPEKVLGGRVIWITGLSGTGKSTLASALMSCLPGSVLLDGDDLRAVLNMSHTGFDRQGRLELGMTYARLCRLLAEQGHTVIIATISLFHEVHAWNRVHLPNYLEVFLHAPEGVLRARDPKGLYAAAKQGKLTQMAGQDTEIDFPKSPHLALDTEKMPKEDCVAAVLAQLNA